MSQEQLVELVEAGVHFGHQTRRWNPKMKNFIMETRNGIHIINIEKTIDQVETASNFLSDLAKKGKHILFVGCKRQAQEAVEEAAKACGQFFVNNRWLGGTLTNMATIKKSIARLQYLEDLPKLPEFKAMSKKEIAALNREKAKLGRNLKGIRNMEKLPDAIVIVDSAREHIAVHEASRLNIPIVAMVDSNADPDKVDYPIASNDDAIRAIRIILQKLIGPIIEAQAEAKK
jgi:small subunit ribosomal protein S2